MLSTLNRFLKTETMNTRFVFLKLELLCIKLQELFTYGHQFLPWLPPSYGITDDNWVFSGFMQGGC